MKDETLHIQFCFELGGASAPMMTQQEECTLNCLLRLVDGAARFWAWWWYFIDYLLFCFSLCLLYDHQQLFIYFCVSWCVVRCAFQSAQIVNLELWDLTLYLISHRNIMSYGPDEVTSDWIKAWNATYRRSITFLQTSLFCENGKHAFETWQIKCKVIFFSLPLQRQISFKGYDTLLF